MILYRVYFLPNKSVAEQLCFTVSSKNVQMIWHLNANDSEYDQVNEDILS